jgi:acetyl esterase/lipase
MFSLSSLAQKTIPLWPSQVPGNKDHQVREVKDISPRGAKLLKGVSVPEMWFYKSNCAGECPAILICPGGGYAVQAYEHEGTQVAEWLNNLGIHAFVLKYRLPDERICTNPVDVPLMDAQQAIQLIRKSAVDYKIDADKIGIMGFSAGGHLAACCSNLSQSVYDPNKTLDLPDFSILIYPVISMKNQLTHMGSRTNLLGKKPDDELIRQYSMEEKVSVNTPSTFICHAKDDEAVIAKNTIVYQQALIKNGVKVEMHLLSSGGHGFGMNADSPAIVWLDHLEMWLRKNVL